MIAKRDCKCRRWIILEPSVIMGRGENCHIRIYTKVRSSVSISSQSGPRENHCFPCALLRKKLYLMNSNGSVPKHGTMLAVSCGGFARESSTPVTFQHKQH